MKGRLVKSFYEDHTVENRLPANYKKEDDTLFASARSVHIPKSGLFLLNRVFVTDLGIVYKNFSALKENITCYDIDFKQYRWRYLFKAFFMFEKRRYRGGKCLLVFDNYSGPNGFAHWLCDGLTRLAEMHDTLKEYVLVVPWYFASQPLYVETLKLFNASELHVLPKNSTTWFNELYVPGGIGDTGNFHPANVKKLQTIVRDKLKLTQDGQKNVYISRAKASRRFVQNENALLPLLKQYNFELVYLEEHSFEAQVRIIAAAANIVSIHGAALSLLLFANAESSVLELRGKTDAVNNMYYIIASICGLKYYYLNCDAVKNSNIANDFDLSVDLKEFEHTLQQMTLKK